MKILVTRPLEDALKIAKQLDQVIIAPLLKINYGTAVDLNGYEICLVTSRHALRFINNKDIKVLVVGENLFQEALELGLNALYLGQDISSAKTKINKNDKLIYLSGQDVADNLSEFANLKREIVYEAEQVLLPNKDFFNFLNINETRLALFFSVRNAKIFLQTINKYRLDNQIHDIIAISLSPKIADILKDHQFKGNYAAAMPTLKSMIKMIDAKNEL